jgi:hypothetical protein
MGTTRSLLGYIKSTLKTCVRYPSLQTFISCIKYYSAWRLALEPGRTSMKDKLAWITFPSIDAIKKILTKDMVLFEYGSGGSTLFWANQIQHVTSVEHDAAWYSNVKQVLLNEHVHNVDYYLFEAEPDPDYKGKSAYNPKDYISTDEHSVGMKYERYVKKIDEYPDEHFDIILVDGRARPSCIEHAIAKLKVNGYLVVDNTERDYYLQPFPFNKGEWQRKDYPGPVPYIYHFTQTTLLKKLKPAKNNI